MLYLAIMIHVNFRTWISTTFFWLKKTAFFLIITLLLCQSAVPPGDQTERVRTFTRQIEFDFFSWVARAIEIKGLQYSIGGGNFIPLANQSPLVLDYLNLIAQITEDESKLETLYTDPSIKDPQTVSQELRSHLGSLYNQRASQAPLAETILESQVSTLLADKGLTWAGQPIPPVLYHVSPPPFALIISPRSIIRQDEDISLISDLTLDQIVDLENEVTKNMNVSALVVDIGGVGVYPTMVMQTTDVNWLAEVIAHEWTHNYLTLRPLGINYFNSPELRTMNETTASIVGKEVGRAVIARFYPDHLPPSPSESTPPASPSGKITPPPFNFQREMHLTRITADKLLAQGEIEKAEAYMETRRRLFWDHGYAIRKLNQAYFAFHGAYADTQEGAAGADPIGSAVRTLRAHSPSLAAFVERMAWMGSADQLMQAVTEFSSQKLIHSPEDVLASSF